MKEIIKLLAVTFLILNFQLKLKSHFKSESLITFVKIELDTNETQYPWSSEITELAIEAINQSIRNLKLPKKERPKNFPNSPGPYNVRFTQNKIVDFELIGYSFSENEPNIYDIEFRPKHELDSGNRTTVKVNIEAKKVIMVYMQADA